MNVSVYVQAIDGLLYKDPMIAGVDWFISFRDDEIVMKRHGNTTEKSARRAAHLKLLEAGIEFELGATKSLTELRSFPPTWSAKPASAIYFTLLGPIPIPRNYGGVKIKPTKLDPAGYIFWYDFSTKTIVESMIGLEVDLFLLDSQQISVWDKDPAGSLRKCLEEQYPILESVKADNYEEALRNLPEVLRIKWRAKCVS